MNFSYQAYDRAGKLQEAVIQAADNLSATDSLRRQGLLVAKLSPVSEGQSLTATRSHWVPQGRRLRHLESFCRQLHVLVSTGTPLVQALGAVERQASDPRWKQCMRSLREAVESGTPLSAAMEMERQYFDSLCQSLVASGETSGNLGDMIGRLGILVRKQLQLRNTLVGALVYPAVLIFIGISVLLLMLLFVLPRFAGLFQSLEVPLPPTTRWLLGTSDFVLAWWPGLLCGIGAGAVGLRFWLMSDTSHRHIHDVALACPKIGGLIKNLTTARMARMLGTLIESKVQLLDALKLTKQAEHNYRYIELVGNAEEAVSKGNPLSAAFADPRLINPSVYEAMRSGEQSGKTGSLLVSISEFLDEENEIVLRALTRTIEPLILVAMGVLVGFIALSMFLPLFDLTAMAQGG